MKTSKQLKAFYDEVARHADTQRQGINAATVSRVLSTAFKVLAKCRGALAFKVVYEGLTKAVTSPE